MKSPKIRFLAFNSLTLLLALGCAHSQKRTAFRSAAATSPPVAISREDSEAADEDLSQEVPLGPLRQQGTAFYLRGDYPRAISVLETASVVEPSPESWTKHLLFYCQMAVGNYSEALAAAQNILKTHPFQSLSYQQVGLAQLWSGQNALAAEAFQRALEFESHAPRIHFYLGLTEAVRKGIPARDRAFQEAVGEYEQILKRNPNDFTAHYELSSLLLYWNREIDSAALHLNAAKDSLIHNPDEDLPPERRIFQSYYLPLLEGILLFRKGESKASIQSLVTALTNLPSGSRADLAEIYAYLGRDYLALGNTKTAKEFLERSLQSDPKGPAAAETQKTLKSLPGLS